MTWLVRLSSLGLASLGLALALAVKTTTARLTEHRRMTVELLLVERNHICAVCVSNGHCELQTMATNLGVSTVRLAYNFP